MGGSPVRRYRCEPGRFWLRYAPRGWPGPEGLWIDLAEGRPGRRERGQEEVLEDLERAVLDDVLYLPPVEETLRGRRDRIAARHLERGTPVLVQLRPGDPPAPEGSVAFWDLLPWLAGGLTEGTGDPPGVVAWPLVAGLVDGAEREERLAWLAGHGAEVVQAVRLELPPGERRRLVERLGEEAFSALFHGEPPDERELARASARHGMGFLSPRPLPRPPLLGGDNLRLAALLTVAGELALRLGQRPSRGHAFLRAARWVERSRHDLRALAREGNLGVLPWLEEEPRRVVEEAAGGGGSALVEELRAGYLAAGWEPDGSGDGVASSE